MSAPDALEDRPFVLGSRMGLEAFRDTLIDEVGMQLVPGVEIEALNLVLELLERCIAELRTIEAGLS